MPDGDQSRLEYDKFPGSMRRASFTWADRARDLSPSTRADIARLERERLSLMGLREEEAFLVLRDIASFEQGELCVCPLKEGEGLAVLDRGYLSTPRTDHGGFRYTVTKMWIDGRTVERGAHSHRELVDARRERDTWNKCAKDARLGEPYFVLDHETGNRVE